MKKYIDSLQKSLSNMKKHTLLIIIGGVFLLAGIVLYNGRGSQTIYYINSKLSVDEAKALIIDRTKSIMDLYEKVDDTFTVDKKAVSSDEADDKNQYVKVTNYDTVVDSIYSEKGKIELEEIMFNKKAFVEKKEDGIYLLSQIPSDNSYLNSAIVVDNISIKEDEVSASVMFTSDNVDLENINYFVYQKDIKLTKIDDKWLVDTFIYPNV